MSKLFRLKTKQERKDLSSISVNIDKQENNLLSLYCLYTEQTKSTVLRGMIDEWKKQLDVTEQEMLDRLVERAVNNWKGRWTYSDNWDKTFDEFVTDIENTLRSRGLNKSQIEYIKDHIKEKINDTKDEKDK